MKNLGLIEKRGFDKAEPHSRPIGHSQRHEQRIAWLLLDDCYYAVKPKSVNININTSMILEWLNNSKVYYGNQTNGRYFIDDTVKTATPPAIICGKAFDTYSQKPMKPA